MNSILMNSSQFRKTPRGNRDFHFGFRAFFLLFGALHFDFPPQLCKKQLGCDRQRYEKDFKRNPRKAEIDEILEIKRLTAWRTCKRAKREMT